MTSQKSVKKCKRCCVKKSLDEFKVKRNGETQKVCMKCLLKLKTYRDNKLNNNIIKLEDNRKEEIDLQQCGSCKVICLMKHFGRKKNNKFYKTCTICRIAAGKRYIKIADRIPLEKPVLKRQIAEIPVNKNI